MRRRVLPVLITVLLAALLLASAACSDSDGGAGDATSTEPTAEPTETTEPTEPTEPTESAATALSPAATGELDGVTITDKAGPEPKVEVDAPYSVEATTVQVLEEGAGRAIADGDQVSVQYVLANAGSGTILDSSYDRDRPLQLLLQTGPGGILPGLYSGLLGQTAGSRIALAIPPVAGFGPQGNPQFGVQPGETLVFVLEIADVAQAAEMAAGKEQAPPADLPTLEVDDSGVPQRFVADGDEPAALKELVVAPIIVGDGPKVEPGATLTVHYLGQLYPDGEVFDESWTDGQPFGFQVGTGGVIPGWDQGLTGQRVGSRVILAIPSKLGYGEQGQPPDIPPDADLIFAVDILAAG